MLLVSGSKMVSAGCGFLATILIARNLGTKDFGLYSLAAVVTVLLAELAGGSIAQALVKFTSHHLRNNRDRADLFYKVTLEIVIVVAAGLIATSLFLSAPLSRVIFKGTETQTLVVLVFLGAAGLMFFKYILAIYQSHQVFARHAFLETGHGLVKLAVIVLLIGANVLNVETSLAVYGLIPFLGFIVGFSLTSRKFVFTKGRQREIVSELAHLAKWIFLSYVVFALYSRLDTLLLSHYREARDVGIYSSAVVLTTSFEALSLAVFTIVFPRISRFSSKEEYRHFVRSFLTLAFPSSALLCFVFWVFAEPLVLMCFTSDFGDSVAILRTLLPGSAIFMIAVPLSSLLLSMNKPHVLVSLDLVTLIVMLAGSLLLIPPYGGMGAAIASSASRSAFFVLLLHRVSVEIRGIPSRP